MRRLHVLRCGYEVSDKAALTLLKDAGKKVKVPYHSYLIEDPEGAIIVDTGASVRWKELHPRELVKYWPVHLKENEHLDVVLAGLGFSPRDINFVINTHLHYDHCGNNEMFPRATFLVSGVELAHAMSPGWWEAFSYVRSVFNPRKIRYQAVKGKRKVLPGLSLIPTPGHTEGHQSVVVELEKTGPVVLAGDAIYLRENLEGPILPGIYVDARRYAESAAKLKGLVDNRNGTMLLSHSREFLTPHGWRLLKGAVHKFD